MVKTINRDKADFFIEERKYSFRDISGRDNFVGFAIVHEDKEVIKVKQSIYYYLTCDEES